MQMLDWNQRLGGEISGDMWAPGWNWRWDCIIGHHFIRRIGSGYESEAC